MLSIAGRSVCISGATGNRAGYVNGIYDATDGGTKDGVVVVYEKRGDPSRILEWCYGEWQAKSISNIEEHICWAKVPCSPYQSPENCTGVWSVLVRFEFFDEIRFHLREQSTVKVELLDNSSWDAIACTLIDRGANLNTTNQVRMK